MVVSWFGISLLSQSHESYPPTVQNFSFRSSRVYETNVPTIRVFIIMTLYSLSDLCLVWFAGIMAGGFITYLLCRLLRKSPLSKDDAKTLRHILPYCSLDFRQHFRNGFPIENDPALSVKFPSWPAVNVFVKRMMDILEGWK